MERIGLNRNNKQYKAGLEKAKGIITGIYPEPTLSNLSGIGILLLDSDLGYIKIQDVIDFINHYWNGTDWVTE